MTRHIICLVWLLFNFGAIEANSELCQQSFDHLLRKGHPTATSISTEVSDGRLILTLDLKGIIGPLLFKVEQPATNHSLELEVSTVNNDTDISRCNNSEGFVVALSSDDTPLSLALTLPIQTMKHPWMHLWGVGRDKDLSWYWFHHEVIVPWALFNTKSGYSSRSPRFIIDNLNVHAEDVTDNDAKKTINSDESGKKSDVLSVPVDHQVVVKHE